MIPEIDALLGVIIGTPYIFKVISTLISMWLRKFILQLSMNTFQVNGREVCYSVDKGG